MQFFAKKLTLNEPLPTSKNVKNWAFD